MREGINMKTKIIILIFIVFALVIYLLQPGFQGQSAGSLQDILTQHRGQVLVLLLGRDGCPGTANATLVLDAYAAAQTKGIAVLRLDVSLPGEELKLAGKWSHGFNRLLDKDRRVADELEFFYYPTLYIFDREGIQRFAGGCDKDNSSTTRRSIYLTARASSALPADATRTKFT